MTTFPLHAKTLLGLEQVLADELTALGAQQVELGHRLATCVVDQRTLYRANACCRTAIRFLKPIHQFAATTEKELYAGVQHVEWRKLLDARGALWIDPHVYSSFLTHSLYAAQLAKDAIVDQFRNTSGARPSVRRNDPDLRIGLHLVRNEATIYLDSSGDSLHFRGYRQAKGEAPLNEVLAAGVLRLIGWNGRTPLVDPMCGSGTLLIEAALIARNIAPVMLGREYGFMKWRDYDRPLFQSIYAEARAAQTETPDLQLAGSDIDAQVIEIARQNAQLAGVADAIQFDVKSFDVARPPAAGATLVTNPPYDERLKVDRIGALYKRIGDALKQRFAGGEAWILTGNLDAAKQVGLRPSRKIKLFNGPIECRLLKFDLYVGSKRGGESPSPMPREATVDERPTLTSTAPTADRSPKWIEQAAMFRNRLTRMAKHWHKWARRQGITCFRLYDKDIPDVPLAIDWYEGHLHVAEYVRPHDRAEAEHAAWLDFIVGTAAETLEVPASRVFLKYRQKQKGKSQYERQANSGHRLEVHEGGHKLAVNLADYLDTGLFLDHRQTRAMVQQEAAGKHFLNLFAYTGSFTVYAAAGGAASTTTVDLSNTYLDWAKENLQLNDIPFAAHKFVRSDAHEFLQHRAGQNARPFDLAVVDPPTFSNSKKFEGVWDVQQSHAELLNLLLTQMAVGGVVYFSTNLRRFKFDEEQIGPATTVEITHKTIPPDFRNKRVHRCWRIVRT